MVSRCAGYDGSKERNDCCAGLYFVEYLDRVIFVCVIRVNLVRGKRRVSYVSGQLVSGKMPL